MDGRGPETVDQAERIIEYPPTIQVSRTKGAQGVTLSGGEIAGVSITLGMNERAILSAFGEPQSRSRVRGCTIWSYERDKAETAGYGWKGSSWKEYDIHLAYDGTVISALIPRLCQEKQDLVGQRFR